MTRTLVITTLAAAALAGVLVSAQEGQGRGGNAGPRPRGNSIIGVLDANGDRTISAEEIAAAPAALKKLDRNNDGQLTREEIGPAFGRRGGPPPRGNQTTG